MGWKNLCGSLARGRKTQPVLPGTECVSVFRGTWNETLSASIVCWTGKKFVKGLFTNRLHKGYFHPLPIKTVGEAAVTTASSGIEGAGASNGTNGGVSVRSKQEQVEKMPDIGHPYFLAPDPRGNFVLYKVVLKSNKMTTSVNKTEENKTNERTTEKQLYLMEFLEVFP